MVGSWWWGLWLSRRWCSRSRGVFCVQVPRFLSDVVSGLSGSLRLGGRFLCASERRTKPPCVRLQKTRGSQFSLPRVSCWWQQRRYNMVASIAKQSNNLLILQGKRAKFPKEHRVDLKRVYFSDPRQTFASSTRLVSYVTS